MPWFNVDDGFANSKPVLRIPRRYRCAAIGLWTLAGSWSAKELTDGLIPDHALEEFAGTVAMAEHLVRAGLWRRVEGGWQFEGWAKWQKTKEQVLAFRAAEAERKRKARSGKKTAGENSVSGVDSGRTEPGVTLGHHPESGQPLPTPSPEPKPSSLVDLGGGVTQVAPTGPRPECHEHTENYDGPCRKCKRRREWDEANAGVVAAAEVDRKRALKRIRENCPRCHGMNTYEDETGVVRKCNPHIEAVRQSPSTEVRPWLMNS